MKNLIIKYTITTILFFVLSLIQSSFLPFFSIVGQIPNLVFILFYVILFFDNRGESFFWAILVGFLLDVFMPSYFGISIISLLNRSNFTLDRFGVLNLNPDGSIGSGDLIFKKRRTRR